MIQAIAFYLFATLVIVSGALTITARNPVHAVLWLIFAFFNAAGLMVLVGAEFIAMLLNIDFAELRAGFARYAAIGVVFAIALAAEIMVAFGAWSAGAIELSRRAAPIDPTINNIEAIGRLLYTRYLFVFEGAGLVLLVAMIGAIVLTHRERGGVRGQNVARQNARRPQDATRNTQPGVGQGVEL